MSLLLGLQGSHFFLESSPFFCLLKLACLVLDLLSHLLYLFPLSNLLHLPLLPQLAVESISFLLKFGELEPRPFNLFLLLSLTELVQQLLIRFQLHTGNHLLLHAGFKLVLLCSCSGLNLLLDPLVLHNPHPLLMGHRSLYRVFDCAHVFKPGQALHLVHSDTFLE